MATPASFDSVDLFGPGPRRFIEGPRGEHVVPRAVIDPFDPAHLATGVIETTVRVEGTLVAPSDPDLDTQIETITALLEHPPRVGTLADGLGHEWHDISFTRFERLGPTRRGRVVSQPYLMLFRTFSS
ncbi:MAG: hypothetical protein KF768_03710 [Phycisphaeraceae bacterium]|nr:hypothetical protein [Phycisphaeraceae bacterium]